MSKGWYGNRQKHAMASKGIRSKEINEYTDIDVLERRFQLEMLLLKLDPESKHYDPSVNTEDIDDLFQSLDSRGIQMKRPKEYSEYNSRTLIKLWNIHYKMFNNISSWGGDASDNYDEMNEIQRELAKKGYEPSGEFSQEGNMKFMARGEEEEMAMVMDAFKQVQEAKRKRMEMEYEHEKRMNRFTWDEMTQENKVDVIHINAYPDEDIRTTADRIRNKTFDKSGNIVGE